jgi:hypothetical protein
MVAAAGQVTRHRATAARRRDGIKLRLLWVDFGELPDELTRAQTGHLAWKPRPPKKMRVMECIPENVRLNEMALGFKRLKSASGRWISIGG